MAKRFKMPKAIIDLHNHLWAGDDGSKMVGVVQADVASKPL